MFKKFFLLLALFPLSSLSADLWQPIEYQHPAFAKEWEDYAGTIYYQPTNDSEGFFCTSWGEDKLSGVEDAAEALELKNFRSIEKDNDSGLFEAIDSETDQYCVGKVFLLDRGWYCILYQFPSKDKEYTQALEALKLAKSK